MNRSIKTFYINKEHIYLLMFIQKIHTKNIEKTEAAKKNIAEFYNQVILISSGGGPRYYFDNINDIKPEILADSIKNAKLAALKFEKHSSSKLGKIKNANQGYFEFLPIDRSLGIQEHYPKKILRVVTTVSYYLD
ncbi:SIMPL domain-containing protein [Borreliella garinii]|uniref:SIMPL domain-containing protein n=1 Tax=Borreliella garinii TaxID=29519 RepID=UPI00226CFA76